jgi:predicted small lipoprotein YifL
MKTEFRNVSVALAGLLVLAGVMGCGNKGPLVMPVRPAAAPAPAPVATPVNDAPAAMPVDGNDSEAGR